MLKKYQVAKMVDDLDGSEATRTIRFSIDGAHYEIDLSKENADQLPPPTTLSGASKASRVPTTGTSRRGSG